MTVLMNQVNSVKSLQEQQSRQMTETERQMNEKLEKRDQLLKEEQKREAESIERQLQMRLEETRQLDQRRLFEDAEERRRRQAYQSMPSWLISRRDTRSEPPLSAFYDFPEHARARWYGPYDR